MGPKSGAARHQGPWPLSTSMGRELKSLYTHNPHDALPPCCCLVAKLCPTLANPWTITCKAPLPMGFLRQEYWSGFPFPSAGDLTDQGSNAHLLHVRCILYLWATGEVPLPLWTLIIPGSICKTLTLQKIKREVFHQLGRMGSGGGGDGGIEMEIKWSYQK